MSTKHMDHKIATLIIQSMYENDNDMQKTQKSTSKRTTI